MKKSKSAPKTTSKPLGLMDRLHVPASSAFRRGKLGELVKVYEDLEKTLRGLQQTVKKNGHNPLQNINVQKLISQLSKSKRKLERKIGNTFLNEREHLKQTIERLTHKGQKNRTVKRTNSHLSN